jgi:hypothetical protein
MAALKSKTTSTGTKYVPSKTVPLSKTSSSNKSSTSDSFFDFKDRHTSHLSSPAAQGVVWSERKGLFVDIPEGHSKPDPLPDSETKPRQMVASSYNQSTGSSGSPAESKAKQMSTVGLNQGLKERFNEIAGKSADQRTSEDMEFLVSFQRSLGIETSVSRKFGSIPGRQRPDVSSPVSSTSSSATSSSSASSLSSAQPSTGAPATSVAVAYDIVFIVNQLALGKISQDQFDALNSKLLYR